MQQDPSAKNRLGTFTRVHESKLSKCLQIQETFKQILHLQNGTEQWALYYIIMIFICKCEQWALYIIYHDIYM